MSDKPPVSYGKTYGLRGLVVGAVLGLLGGLNAHSVVSGKTEAKRAEKVDVPAPAPVSAQGAAAAKAAYDKFVEEQKAKGIPERVAPPPPEKVADPLRPPTAGIEPTSKVAVATVSTLLLAFAGAALGRKIGGAKDAFRRAEEMAKDQLAGRNSNQLKHLEEIHGTEVARAMMDAQHPEWAAATRAATLRKAEQSRSPSSP